MCNLVISALTEMGLEFDDIQFFWPIPEARSFPNSLNFDFFTRQNGA